MVDWDEEGIICHLNPFANSINAPPAIDYDRRDCGGGFGHGNRSLSSNYLAALTTMAT